MGFSSDLRPFRRRFLRRAVAAAIALPGLAFAQTAGDTRRVAAMFAGDPAAVAHLLKALVGGLAELGWVEGRNLQLDIRYGDNDAARIRRFADELLALRPDVFVAANEVVARVVAPLTKTVRSSCRSVSIRWLPGSFNHLQSPGAISPGIPSCLTS